MILILNILFGILAFFVVRWLAVEMSVPANVATVLGVIVGIVVFLLNLGAQFAH